VFLRHIPSAATSFLILERYLLLPQTFPLMALHLAEPDQLQIGTEPPYDAGPVDWPFDATKAYLLDEASLAETITRLASPIDEL